MQKTLIFAVVAILLLVGGSMVSNWLDDEVVKQEAVEQQQIQEQNEKLMSELDIEDTVVGTGVEAVTGKTVTVHYTGRLTNGTKFDSSHDRKEPFTLLLGSGAVIKGWDLGLVGMKVGGTRRLTIPPHLAYGEQGAGGGLIPPSSTLVFDIELLDVK